MFESNSWGTDLSLLAPLAVEKYRGPDFCREKAN